jgi:hypothetical protein
LSPPGSGALEPHSPGSHKAFAAVAAADGPAVDFFLVNIGVSAPIRWAVPNE